MENTVRPKGFAKKTSSSSESSLTPKNLYAEENENTYEPIHILNAVKPINNDAAQTKAHINDFFNGSNQYDDEENIGDVRNSWKTISKCSSGKALYLFWVRGKEVFKKNNSIGTLVQTTETLSNQIVSSGLQWLPGIVLKEKKDSMGNTFWELTAKE